MSQPQRSVSLRRVLRVLYLLRFPRTLEWLASELQVTTRTVHRDFDVLRAVGYKVWKSDEDDCYRLSAGLHVREVRPCGTETSEARPDVHAR